MHAHRRRHDQSTLLRWQVYASHGGALTFVAGQKSFRRAVDRNLMRRRVKNIYRKHKSSWPSRVDIIVLVNACGVCCFHDFLVLPTLTATHASTALEAAYSELEQDMLYWAQSVQGKEALFLPRCATACRHFWAFCLMYLWLDACGAAGA